MKKFNLVETYFKFINENVKKRKGEGIVYEDLKYGQESIKKKSKPSDQH